MFRKMKGSGLYSSEVIRNQILLSLLDGEKRNVEIFAEYNPDKVKEIKVLTPEQREHRKCKKTECKHNIWNIGLPHYKSAVYGPSEDKAKNKDAVVWMTQVRERVVPKLKGENLIIETNSNKKNLKNRNFKKRSFKLNVEKVIVRLNERQENKFCGSEKEFIRYILNNSKPNQDFKHLEIKNLK